MIRKDTQVLDATICDFGVGMIQPIKESFPQIVSDEEAIRKSIEAKFTIGSSLHNGGMGLDYIRSSCTENNKLSIFSNTVCLEADSEDVSVHNLDFDFKGTLINLRITLSHLPDKDYMRILFFRIEYVLNKHVPVLGIVILSIENTHNIKHRKLPLGICFIPNGPDLAVVEESDRYLTHVLKLYVIHR